MRRAIVTGAASGIACAIVHALLDDGWNVLAVDRNRCKYEHDNLRWTVCDVSYYEQVHAELSHERVDALIHAAAVRYHIPIEERSSHWHETIAINLLGTYNVLQTMIPRLKQSRDARVLLFSGGGAFGPAPTPGHSAYAASKAGVVSLMESAAIELRKYGISVNSVAPGPVPTKLTGREVPQDNGEAMARVIEFIRFMLGPETRGLTGKAISVPHDAWQQIGTALSVDLINHSDVMTRTRVKMVEAAVCD